MDSAPLSASMMRTCKHNAAACGRCDGQGKVVREGSAGAVPAGPHVSDPGVGAGLEPEGIVPLGAKVGGVGVCTGRKGQGTGSKGD